ncbi:MAG: GspE/PulE family protein [Acidimicrobiales bacterium]
MTVTPPDLRAAGAQPARPARRRLGEILVELGLVTDHDIENALAEQKTQGKRLGDVLQQRGLVTSRDLLRALAIQFDQDFVDFDEVSIDTDLAGQVSASLARRHRAIPIRFEGDTAVVAMANPADLLAIDDLRTALGRNVRAVMADGEQIGRAIDGLGTSDTRVEEAIQAAVGQSTARAPEPVTVVQETANESPIVQFVDLLLSKAVQERASDVHIEPSTDGLRVRFRVDGLLSDAMTPPKSLQAGIISRLKVMADIDIAEKRQSQDGRISRTIGGGSYDIRVVTLPTVHGESAVLRLLANDRGDLDLNSLGFLPRQLATYREGYRRPWGAVLVTGPTGSGKSTTLYATLRELRDPTRNIITIEDPVEYRLDGVKQVQINAKAGLTFPRALRSFLRADPDVILVGEIRDGETATIAVEASLTGHLVLSTIHTNNAASTPMRLIEMGVEPFLVASSLSTIVAQRLARRLCDRCKQPHRLSAERRHELGVPESMAADDGTLEVYQPVGCPACSDAGYRGRFAVHEVLPITNEVAAMVLDQAPADAVERHAMAAGMVPLRVDGMSKVMQGLTSVEELLRIIR